MKAEVTWQANNPNDDLVFDGICDDGQKIQLNGSGTGLSPMQSVLMSVGACSSVDVVEILKKSRQNIDSCVCKLEAKRAEDPPRVFTDIHAHFSVHGADIKEKHLQRAVQLSCEKYCSVMLMLVGKVNITTSYSVND